jgi:hypothetical protein
MRLVALAVLAVALILITNIDIPSDRRFAVDLQNSGHAPLFGVAALVLRRIFQVPGTTGPRAAMRDWGVALGGTLALGVLTESVQYLTASDADVADIVTDVLGGVSFLALRASWRTVTKGGMRWALRLTGAMILAGVFWPPVFSGMAIVHTHRKFPILVDFESILDRQCCGSRNANFEILPAPRGLGAGSDGHVGRIVFQPSDGYPGFSVREPYADWRGYENLRFAVYSEAAEPIRLGLRVHDRRHNHETRDRYEAALVIQPGPNRVVVALETIAQAPATRRMDMSAIASIVLFAIRPKTPVTIYVDDFRLE